MKPVAQIPAAHPPSATDPVGSSAAGAREIGPALAPGKRLRARAADCAGLPEDPALPALAAIREGLADAFPELGLGGRAVEPLPLSYAPGARITLAVRAGADRFLVKAYAPDPAEEAQLYRALAAAGLAGDSGPRVPRLLGWSPELKAIAIEWLEGPEGDRLLKAGKGRRVGELAAIWLTRLSTADVKLGPRLDGAEWMRRVGELVAALAPAAPGLGVAAAAVAARLERTLPTEPAPKLVHGTFYPRHLLDLGDAPGVIDWQRFGQGALEIDGGWFLAMLWRAGLRDPHRAGQAAEAEAAFLSGTRGLLDHRGLAWHRAVALMLLLNRMLKRRQEDWVKRALMFLGEATRVSQAAN